MHTKKKRSEGIRRHLRHCHLAAALCEVRALAANLFRRSEELAAARVFAEIANYEGARAH